MKISITLAALTGSFETDMARASKTTQRRMKEIEKAAKDAGRIIGTAIVAGATAAAVALKAAIDRADELSKTAQKIGVTTESLSTLAYAAKLADVELTALQGGLNRLTRAQQGAQEGNEKLVSLFKALGVEFENADGTLRGTDETFRDLAKALDRLPDGATKTAAAIELMGRSGANLIPLTKNLEEAEQRARDLGLELSTETGKSAEEFNDQLEDLKLMVVSLATSVAADLLPDLVDLVTAFSDGIREGGGFAQTGSDIADALRTVADVAYRSYKFIEAVVLGVTSLIAKVIEFQATMTPLGIFIDKLTGGDISRVAGDLGAVTGARASAAFDAASGIDTATPTPTRLPGQGTGIRGGAARMAESEAAAGAAAEKALADALKAAREEAARAAEAKQANAAANRAAADAARDAEKAAEREAEAAKKLNEARYEQQRELRELREDEKRQLEEALKPGKDLVSELQFELELMKMTNAERAKAIQLRGLDAEAIAMYGDEIAALNDEIEANIRIAEGLDVVRGATEGLFNDLMSGAKSAKEAFMDFVDGILEGIAQIVARNLTESLLGSFGSTGGGASGNGLASIFGAFFGGARAGGGSVYPNKAYLVGEEGPEMFIPPVAGSIATASQTRKMGGGTSVTQNITVVGTVDRRAADRMRIDAANNQRKAVSRSY